MTSGRRPVPLAGVVAKSILIGSGLVPDRVAEMGSATTKAGPVNRATTRVSPPSPDLLIHKTVGILKLSYSLA